MCQVTKGCSRLAIHSGDQLIVEGICPVLPLLHLCKDFVRCQQMICFFSAATHVVLLPPGLCFVHVIGLLFFTVRFVSQEDYTSCQTNHMQVLLLCEHSNE